MNPAEYMGEINTPCGPVRYVVLGTKTWMVASDVTRALGYKGKRAHIITQKIRQDHKTKALVGTIPHLLITTQAMVHICLACSLPNARDMLDWTYYFIREFGA